MRARLVTLLGAMVAVAASSSAGAHRPVIVAASGVDVALVCEDSPCQEVMGHGQRWVVATFGERYAIAVTNRSDQWVEAVITVDGRSILDGQRTSSRSRGYLVPPRDRITIDGWRTSASAVAAFRFTSVGDSYAGRTGDASDAGVVRVQIYPERAPVAWVPPPRPRPTWEDDDGGGGWGPRPAPELGEGRELRDRGDAPSESKAARAWEPERQNLGTGYGEGRWQPVRERAFERANPHSPARTLTLRYDDRAGLEARGILPGRRWIEPDDRRWVPPPPPRWWDD